MAKGDTARNKLGIQLNVKCHVTTSDGQAKDTDDNGWVEFDFNKELTLIGFTATPFDPNFLPVDFQFSFIGPMNVTCPRKEPDPPPVDDNFLDESIDQRYSAVDSSLFGNAILIKDRTIVYKWGNIDEYEDNYASVCRFWTNLIWGDWIAKNGMQWLANLVNILPSSPTALTVNSNMALANLLSYTTPGSWVYSGGEDSDGIARWPKQFSIINELYGTNAAEVIKSGLFQKLGGTFNAWMISDGTMRIGGSCRDLWKGARLLFNRGKWNGEQLIPEEYVDRTLLGGPWGDGVPFNLEGFQTHLIRNGSAWEMEDELPGVPDGFMARSSKSYIIGIPSLGLIMAGKGPEQLQSEFLPQIVELMKQ